ncbi:MAG: O-antigen ligase family protein [Lachnospiraceae bacterium]|nr:O-antigen ligase family protein [Lachnospiraceae bacterium]
MKKRSFDLSDWASSIYLVVMFSVFPYYHADGFYYIGDHKYRFFQYATLALLAAVAVSVLLRGIGRAFPKQDIPVLAYASSAAISFLFCIDRRAGLYGTADWRMGLISQVAFVFLYLVISRKWSWRDSMFPLICISSAGVFLLGILNRFYVDPLGMYEGMDDAFIQMFLSTIGQSTWYSSFVCVLFPVGIFLFWKKAGWQSVGYMVLAFSAAVTSGSDSAVAALGVVMLMVMWRAFGSRDDWRKFLQLLMVMCGTFAGTGALRRLFPAVEIGGLAAFLSDGRAAIPALAILSLGYWRWSCRQYRWDAGVMRRVRNILYAGIGACVSGVLAFVVLNSVNGWVEGSYLLFDESFGNNRGFTWMLTARLYEEFPFMRKMFGVGPDCYEAAVYARFSSQLNHLWGNDAVLSCAHNEMLNALVCYGAVGAVAYYGIFAAELKRCLKVRGISEEFAVALCIASYLAHNFFCYQQVVCTPFIFLLMGMAESRLRKR